MRKSARSRLRVMIRKKARSSGWVRNWMVVAFHVFGMVHVVTPVERSGPPPRPETVGARDSSPSGSRAASRLIHVDFDNHICHLGRGVLAVELGRQGTQVAQVLALKPALQHLDGDAPAQVEKIPRV